MMPWGSLFDDDAKVLIQLKDVHLLLVVDHESTQETLIQYEQRVKQRLLAAMETLRSTSVPTWWQAYLGYANQYVQYANIWLVENLVYRLLAKAEVTIEAVHIRTEVPARPNLPAFALGLSLHSFNLRTLDAVEAGASTSGGQESVAISKSLEVTGLSVYADTLRGSSPDMILRPLANNPRFTHESLARLLAEPSSSLSHRYVLEDLAVHAMLQAEVNSPAKTAEVLPLVGLILFDIPHRYI